MDQLIIEFKIKYNTDPVYASYKTVDISKKMGFRKTKCQEIGIIVSELGTNIIKYGVEGTITIYSTDKNHGLRIVAKDEGEGILNVAYALKDNYTDTGPIFTENGERKSKSSGLGLAAIKRLSNNIRIYTTENGSVIECTIYQ